MIDFCIQVISLHYSHVSSIISNNFLEIRVSDLTNRNIYSVGGYNCEECKFNRCDLVFVQY